MPLNTMNADLKELREQIDRIDTELITLLKERMAIVSAIGTLKKGNLLEPLDTKRWQEVLETRIKLGAESGLTEQIITKVWNAIHEESLAIERNQ